MPIPQSRTATLHVHRGDTVKVAVGRHNQDNPEKNDKGKVGKVLRVFPRKGTVVVEGVNITTRAVKPTQTNPKGGFERKEAAIPVGRVRLICTSCNKTTRLAFKTVNDKKVRYCKKCNAVVETARD